MIKHTQETEYNYKDGQHKNRDPHGGQMNVNHPPPCWFINHHLTRICHISASLLQELHEMSLCSSVTTMVASFTCLFLFCDIGSQYDRWWDGADSVPCCQLIGIRVLCKACWLIQCGKILEAQRWGQNWRRLKCVQCALMGEENWSRDSVVLACC